MDKQHALKLWDFLYPTDVVACTSVGDLASLKEGAKMPLQILLRDLRILQRVLCRVVQKRKNEG